MAREVALKEVKSGSASTEAVRRLIKEAQITGQLQHPNIVPVYEVNRGGRPFYTMKLVKGETLSKAIRRHHEQNPKSKANGGRQPTGQPAELPTIRLTPDVRRDHTPSMFDLLTIFVNVCEALAYAHSPSIIHRDLKPENIVLGDYREAIVLDWSLAKQIGSADEETAPVVLTDDAQSPATRLGATPDTPAYVSPEQAAGRVDLLDHRTDIYGLGTILFEILTGHPPHRAARLDPPATGLAPVVPALLHYPNPSEEEVVRQPVEEVVQKRGNHPDKRGGGMSLHDLLQRISEAPTPRARDLDPTISRELDAICATAMAKQRDERYQTANNVKAALLNYQVHKDSIELTTAATEALAQARFHDRYQDYGRAQFGFEQALHLWQGNSLAIAGLTETLANYARIAFDRGDYKLALTIVEESAGRASNSTTTAEMAALRSQICLAVAERASRQDRLQRLRKYTIGAVTAVIVVMELRLVSRLLGMPLLRPHLGSQAEVGAILTELLLDSAVAWGHIFAIISVVCSIPFSRKLRAIRPLMSKAVVLGFLSGIIFGAFIWPFLLLYVIPNCFIPHGIMKYW